MNRNKQSIVINLKTDDGQKILQELALQCDVLVENFRPGTLKKYGLDFETLQKKNPKLIYCSVTGFGQTGSMRDMPGYDFMIQAMGGIMSITGEPEGEPMKVGVAVADLFTGQNAVIAILAALQARTLTGEGQHLDISLFDSQLGWLANVASSYLVSGNLPKRYGNAHANIVPYQSFRASDGWFVITVGNDKQFETLCQVIERPELMTDPRFMTNSKRVENRDALVEILKLIFEKKSADEWLIQMEGKFPCGPINNFEQVFSMPQVKEREMVVEMEHPTIGRLPMVGSPLKMSGTPVEYRIPPPLKGEHTPELLKQMGYADEQIRELREKGCIN